MPRRLASRSSAGTSSPVRGALLLAGEVAVFGLLIGCAAEQKTAVPNQANTPTTATTVTTSTTSPGAGAITTSPACEAAMMTAGAEPNSTAAEPLIVATLSACASAEEWYAALRAHPEAFGLTTQATIGVNDIELRNACYRNQQKPVCVDAAEQGRLPR